MTSSNLLQDSITHSKRKSLSARRSGIGINNSHMPTLRLGIFKILTVGIFLLLVAALARVQVFEGPYYRDLADGNRVKEVDLPPPRGIIYDRNGNPLVANLPAFRFKECKSKDENCTSSTISKEQAINLEVGGLKANQSLVVDSVRSYLFSEATAHLLGYVSEVNAKELEDNSNFKLGDMIGRGGVEGQFDSLLLGKHGKELEEIDALGKKLRSFSTIPPVAGKRVDLTIDLPLQKTAYEQIQGRKAAVVATNPNNGEVLALVSSPSFDPNVFTDLSITPDERTQKINYYFSDSSQPLFDRAIAGTYPAGSTFKIVTSTAGLESGKIDENFTIDDPGVLIIGPYKFPNWKYLQNGGTQGVLNVVGALKVSNDIFFYKVGEAVGVDGLSQWALKYGLTKKTGIDLPGEAGGSFPTKEWRTKFARDWYLGDTYHLAIGQGDMLATPLQDNRWTTVIANGGWLCEPHVLQWPTSNDQHPANCTNMGLHPKTLQLIKQGMVEACSPGGTAYPLFNFKDPKDPTRTIQIACKTGTAEFGEATNRTHAWLTAFAPADNPTIAVTVILEGAGEGADVASPVVAKMMENWFGR